MVSCVFPGSFDPPTRGHLDLIARAASMFDRVTVVVMVNVNKMGSIPIQARMDMLGRICRKYPNVAVESWNGLLTEYLRSHRKRIIIRGVRSGAELEHELPSAEANRKLFSKAETLYLPTSPPLACVSSSAVREIASFGGDISAFVPEEITEEILSYLSKN